MNKLTKKKIGRFSVEWGTWTDWGMIKIRLISIYCKHTFWVGTDFSWKPLNYNRNPLSDTFWWHWFWFTYRHWGLGWTEPGAPKERTD